MKNKNSGFSLVELVIVIAIVGILSGIIALVIRTPILAYEDTIKRAELADQGSSAIRMIKKDIKMSLPNSMRISNSEDKTYLEFLSIINGGKYRSQNTIDNNGNILDFNIADDSFDILSEAITFSGDEKIVVANIGTVAYDAYALDNMATYNGITNTPVKKIVINPKQFPLESINENFYVVKTPITYVCDKNSKQLIKYWNYEVSANQPVNTLISPLNSAKSTLVANNISNCNFVYSEGENSRNGIVTIIITLANESQKATLYGDTYVRNN